MSDEQRCEICGQTRERHTAPAYADHPWTNQPPTPTTKEQP